MCGVKVDMDAISANVMAAKQKNDRCGLGRVAYVAGIPKWGSASSSQAIQDWLSHRGRMKINRKGGGRTTGDGARPPTGPSPDALFAPVARSRFGYGLPTPGFSAPMERTSDGKVAPLRQGGTRMYLIHGTQKEARQELCG